MYDEYDDGEGGGASLGRKLALGIGVVAIAGAGFFAFRAVTGDDGGDDQVSPAAAAASTSGPSGASQADSTISGAVTSDEDGEIAGGATTDSTVGVTASSRATTTTDAGRPAATTTTAAPATTTTAAPATTAPAVAVAPAYETQPDGTPKWVIATYYADRITLTGAVPSEEAKAKLEALAVANAKPGQAATVENGLTINPAVPLSVGARIVELTSTRFPEGSVEVLPEHAAELDRVVRVMELLPHITALVIGHADQRGDELTNFRLSEERADAVTNYMVSRGIAPSRLSSRAVGESDLLDLGDSDAAFELNRRTEFVIFGLLL